MNHTEKTRSVAWVRTRLPVKNCLKQQFSNRPKPVAGNYRRQQSLTSTEPSGGALQGASRCCRQRLPFVDSFDTAAGKPCCGSHKGNLDTPTDSRSCSRPPSAGYLVDAFAPGGWFSANLVVGTGVEPVTSRFTVWCSPSELTVPMPPHYMPCPEHALPTEPGQARRWSGDIVTSLQKRRRWESNPLECCFAGSRRTVWLQRRKRPRQESNLDLNLRRVACQSSTPRGRNCL